MVTLENMHFESGLPSAIGSRGLRMLSLRLFVTRRGLGKRCSQSRDECEDI